MALDCTFLQRNFSRFRRARRSSSHPWFPAWGLRASGGRCFAKDHERMAVAVEEQANESAVSLLPSFLFVLSLLFTFESSVVDKVVFGMRLETKRKRRRLFLFAFLGCVQSSSISTATSSISRFRRLSSAVKVVQPCSDRKVVQVQNVSLTCDSPGAYYYGSNTYRDSTTCTQGDKAKLLVDFTVTNQFKSEYIYIEISLGIYNQYVRVYTSTDMCSMSGLSSYYDFNCPNQGAYKLEVKVTVPELREYGYHYTPDVRIQFRDEKYRHLGCGTTGTDALQKYAIQRSTVGVYIMLAALLLFVLVFAMVLYQNYRRSKILKHIAEENEKWDRQNSTYIRTEENGQIYIVPKRLAKATSFGGSSRASRSIADDGSLSTAGGPRTATAVVRITSNPEYNETHIPTNPIL